MIKRPYRGEADITLLQNFNAAAIAATNHCGYLHPGDIPHRLFNGNKYDDPTELMTIWEDEQGVAAWVLTSPRHKEFEAQLRPDCRGGAFERDILHDAADRTIELMRRLDVSGDCLYAGAFQGDTTRSDLLVALGWQMEKAAAFVLNRVEINAIEVPSLPEGYSFQSATGVEDAAALAEVHSGSFGSTWTPELYRQVMESPGYAPERELVIRGPNGNYVAFTVTWHDPLNRTGLFEPVGTHKDYHRRGFGRALVLYGMQQMAAAGMKFATVANFGESEAAGGLYRACGFKPWYLLDDYIKRF